MLAINYSAFFMAVCSDILLLLSWILSSHTFKIGKKLVWKKWNKILPVLISVTKLNWVGQFGAKGVLLNIII